MEIVPVGVTFRMALKVSAIYKLPAASNATPLGLAKIGINRWSSITVAWPASSSRECRNGVSLPLAGVSHGEQQRDDRKRVRFVLSGFMRQRVTCLLSALRSVRELLSAVLRANRPQRCGNWSAGASNCEFGRSREGPRVSAWKRR